MAIYPVDNDIIKLRAYITKNKLTRKELNKMHIPKNISVKEAREEFETCPYGFTAKVGNPYNENQQKHIRVVSKQGLYDWIIKGTSRYKKQ